jgi:hypothetical protein
LPFRNRLVAPLIHHLDGEAGEFVGRDVLGRAGGLAGDELEAVTGSNVDHGSADALHTTVAVVALLGGAEEQAAVLMHPDMPMAATAESPVDWALGLRASHRPRLSPPSILGSAPQCGDQQQDPDRPYLQRPHSERPGQQPRVSLRPQPGDDPPHEPEVHGEVDEL